MLSLYFTVFLKIKSDNELIECTVLHTQDVFIFLIMQKLDRHSVLKTSIRNIRKYLVNALHNIQFAHHKSFLTQDMAFYIASINPIILNVKSVTFSITKITVQVENRHELVMRNPITTLGIVSNRWCEGPLGYIGVGIKDSGQGDMLCTEINIFCTQTSNLVASLFPIAFP